MSKHAVLSPSGSSCWLNCLASLYMCREIPRTSSSYASEGTLAHALASHCLEQDLSAMDFIGKKFEWEDGGVKQVSVIKKDMAEYVETYIERVREAAFGRILFVENRLSIEGITGEEDAAGTADIIILDDTTLEVRDLKYGLGVPVSAYENTQLMIYALAAIDAYAWFADFKEIRLVIDQVRLGEPSSWTCSREQIEEFREYVKLRADRVLRILATGLPKGVDDVVFCPSEKTCRWCGISGACRAQTDALQRSIADDFTDFEDTEEVTAKEKSRLETYSVEELGASAKAIPFIKDFITAVERQLNSRLSRGEKVPGWKLALGRAGNAKWLDEDAVIQALLNGSLSLLDIFEMVLISPTYAKKKWSKRNRKLWNALEDLVVRAPGKPNVVPESDPREEYVPQGVVDDFDIETTEE